MQSNCRENGEDIINSSSFSEFPVVTGRSRKLKFYFLSLYITPNDHLSDKLANNKSRLKPQRDATT